MNAPRSLHTLAPFAALLLLALVSTPVRAACTYMTLGSDLTQTASASPSNYVYNQSAAYWAAVAVRPQPAEDWDIALFAAAGAEPVCVSTQLASSAFGTGQLDFVIADYNYTAAGSYFPRVSRWSGTGSAYVQYDDDMNLITVDDPSFTRSLSSTDLIRVDDVHLVAGTTYTFDFFPTTGSGAHLMLFRNPGTGTYAAGRGDAVFDVTGPVQYNAPSTGYYGVVVTNDAGVYCSYELGITANGCGSPVALAPGAHVTGTPPNAHVGFDAETYLWMGLAVRGVSSDWDLYLGDSPSGSSTPACISGLLASSASAVGNQVDVVVGDFNHSPFGWYFGYAPLFSGAGNAEVQATGSAGVLNVNDNAIVVVMQATDLAQARDVYLLAGHTYTIEFTPGTGQTLLLFANVGQGSYFAGRASAVLSTTSTTTYVAPVGGWYGLVVVNDEAIAGEYALAVGDCSAVTTLTPGTVVGTGAAPNAYFSFHQTDGYWSAVCVRNTSIDWDLTVSGDHVASPAPACATTGLAASGVLLPQQDFIVGDFNTNPLGTYYAHARQFTEGVTVPATVEWDAGADVIYPNDNIATTRTTGPNDLIGCWDIHLNAGQTYQFALTRSGTPDVKLLLFRNGGGGVYWTSRVNAVFSTTTWTTYTAPSSGWYGLVAVNDDGGTGSYTIDVATCDPIVAMPAAPTTLLLGPTPAYFLSFTQSLGYWSGVATRSVWPYEDWDVAVYTSATGGVIGYCESGLLANSAYGTGYTDVVVGDFNWVTPGTYYTSIRRWAGTDDAFAQFYSGGRVLPIGGAHQVSTMSSTSLLEMWDCYLTSGQTYSVFFSHDPGLNAKVLLFRATGAVYWGGRASAFLETIHSTTFTATASGYWGVVVINDGGSGTFNLGINTGTLAVDDVPRPERDALHDAAPNPGRAGLMLAFALHDPGTVTFDVIDMAGRRVARVTPGARDPGEWSIPWAATGEGGRPLPPGLYFVRMRIGDRVVGTRKVTLLP